MSGSLPMWPAPMDGEQQSHFYLQCPPAELVELTKKALSQKKGKPCTFSSTPAILSCMETGYVSPLGRRGGSFQH